MKNIDLINNTNYTVARQLFDEIAIWQSNKNPAQSLESLIGDIEKLLDKVEKRGYNKANISQ